MNYSPKLPLNQDIEPRSILKKLAKAHQALAELKGVASSIPNQSILSNTLTLQEAKDSPALKIIARAFGSCQAQHKKTIFQAKPYIHRQDLMK